MTCSPSSAKRVGRHGGDPGLANGARDIMRAYGLAEEGEADGEDGESPMDGEAPDDGHWHEHGHVHADGTAHDHGHPHDHAEPEHDAPGRTAMFANDSDHEHGHEHDHGQSGHHGHPHSHGHEAAAHFEQHNPEGPDGSGSGGDAGELASPASRLALELANLDAAVGRAFDGERRRVEQDAARPARATAEARLTAALDRIGRGSYTMSPQARALGFGGDPGDAGRVLDFAGEAATAGTCGAADDLGYCVEAYHAPDCASLADPDLALALAETGMYQSVATEPWRDENGRTWANQAGTQMDITQMLEVTTGQRLMPDGTSGGWQDGVGSRELVSARRVQRYGEPDDPDDPGADLPGYTRDAARRAAAQMGIAPPDAGRERARYAAQRDAAAAQVARRNMGRRHPDAGESPGERGERLKTGVQPSDLVQLDDTWGGAQPQYTRGRL